MPPVLAVEIAGRDDTVEMMRHKARWCLAHGVEVVWLLIPSTRAALVITPDGEVEYGAPEEIPEHPSLPGLAPRVANLFHQLG